MPNLGYMKPGLEAVEHPTSIEIAWATGLYEGEGSCGNASGTAGVAICQKDHWILYRMKTLFGGSIRHRDAHKTSNIVTKVGTLSYPRNISEWYMSGTRARGFLMTIYKFLSPRRQEQVRKALA